MLSSALDDTVLEVENIGKLYSRDPSNTRRRLAAAMSTTFFGKTAKPIGDLRKGEFWALKDINFTLKRGEAVGVIGLNGSGKTTLLRILSGQLLPDTGEIRMIGSTAAMIDLTAGFQPSASGRDNIFLRGAMLGRARQEMERSADEIIAFTELGDAIDAPVMTYSAGMTLRLAFAIMIATTPDLLFIDEILAVGDFKFRQKCLAKIRQMREHSSFVLVSHNMHDVKFFCTSAIVLNQGRMIFSGDPATAVDHYHSMQEDAAPKTEVKPQPSITGQTHYNESAISDVEHYWCNAAGEPISTAQAGEALYFRIAFRPKVSTRNLVLGVPVWTEQGVNVTGFSTEFDDRTFEAVAGRRAEFMLEVPNLNLNPGTYLSTIGIVDGVEYYYRMPNPPLIVVSSRRRNFGMINHPHNWQQID